jgi:hypothetical protein
MGSEVERYDRMVADLIVIGAEVTADLPRDGMESKLINGVICTLAEFISETKGSGSFVAVDAVAVQRGVDLGSERRRLGIRRGSS